MNQTIQIGIFLVLGDRIAGPIRGLSVPCVMSYFENGLQIIFIRPLWEVFRILSSSYHSLSNSNRHFCYGLPSRRVGKES